MSHDNSQIYRTSPARVGKMMIIMLGICIIGGAIFFGMWDYWISQPAPVVAMMAGDSPSAGPAEHTGGTITQDLHFIESSDFRTLAFNALPGESDNNPTVNMNVGDKVIFNVDNAGISFHSFGVTARDEGVAGIIPGSEIGLATNPLKPGQSDSSEFVAGEEGIYYYICTVPGHRAQGMVGTIIVGDVVAPKPVVEETPKPVVEETPKPVVEETPKPVVEETPEPVEFNGIISLPEGSGVFGCEETNECFIPFSVTVSSGEEIIWSNDDSVAHTVTSGLPGASDEIFDSGILASGELYTLDTTDLELGEYDYYCLIHPWMIGNITVN